MKLLENSKLDMIGNALCMDTGDCKIMGRYERGKVGCGRHLSNGGMLGKCVWEYPPWECVL